MAAGHLRDHQGTLTADVVFRLAGQIEQLDGAEGAALEDKGGHIRGVFHVLRARIRVTRLVRRGIVVDAEVGGRDDAHAGDLHDVPVGVGAVVRVEVAVDQLVVLHEAPVDGGLHEHEAIFLRQVEFIESSRFGVDRLDDVGDGRARAEVGDGGGALVGHGTGFFRQGRLDGQRDQRAVVGLSKGLTHLSRVLGANLVVVLRLVDVGDERVRDQKLIDGDDLLPVLDGRAEDLGARDVVFSADAPDGGELSGLARRDVADAGLVGHDRRGVERGHDFAREHLEEQGLYVAREIGLTNPARNSVCHCVVSLWN